MSDIDNFAQGAAPRRQLIHFIPDVSMGTIINLVSMLMVACGAWATYQSDKATTKLEIDQVKKSVAEDKVGNKESLAELKGDVKEIQRTLARVDQTLAVIQAQQQGRARP